MCFIVFRFTDWYCIYKWHLWLYHSSDIGSFTQWDTTLERTVRLFQKGWISNKRVKGHCDGLDRKLLSMTPWYKQMWTWCFMRITIKLCTFLKNSILECWLCSSFQQQSIIESPLVKEEDSFCHSHFLFEVYQ